MIELRQDRLEFSFPDVHPDAVLRVEFQRTLRIPDDGRETSAADALERVREARPDLILCDVDLPGIDGGDLSAALFADSHARDIPFLFLTALLVPADLEARDNQLAGRGAISKQAPVEEIRRRIRAALA